MKYEYKDDSGRLNNYPIEPKMYAAEPPTQGQKIGYAIAGGIGFLLVAAVTYVAYYVSVASAT